MRLVWNKYNAAAIFTALLIVSFLTSASVFHRNHIHLFGCSEAVIKRGECSECSSDETIFANTSRRFIYTKVANRTMLGFTDINKTSIKSFEVFKSCQLLPRQIFGDVFATGEITFPGVFDSDYYYQVVGQSASAQTGTFITGDELSAPYIVKYNRFNGRAVRWKAVDEVFQNAYLQSLLGMSHVSVRGPLGLHGEHLYIVSRFKGDIVKLRKSDLSVVWELNDVAPFINPLSQLHAKAMDNPEHLGLNGLLVEEINGKVLLFVATTTSSQYGQLGMALTAAPSHYYDWFAEQGRILAYEDHGAHCSLAWDFFLGPTLLQKGDVVPQSAYAPGKTSIRIWYPIVRRKVFAGFYSRLHDTSNLQVNGIRAFRFDKFTAGTHYFTLYDMATSMSPPTRRYSKTFPDKLREPVTYTFEIGDTILDDYTEYVADDLSSTMQGIAFFATGQPIIKRIVNGSNDVIDEYDALGLNYYGCGVWGTMSFDHQTKSLYFGTANAHAIPLEDSLMLASDINDAVSSDSPVAHLHPLLYKPRAYVNTAIAEQSRNVGKNIEDVEWIQGELQYKWIYKYLMIQHERMVREEMSPRANRLLTCAIVSLDAFSGAYQWHHSPSGLDTFTFLQFFMVNPFRDLGLNLDNSVGAVFVTNENFNTRKKRRMFTADKSGLVTHYDPDASYSHSVIGASDRDGIFDRSIPLLGTIVAGFPGVLGGAAWGAAATLDGTKFFTSQANQPFVYLATFMEICGQFCGVPVQALGGTAASSGVGWLSDKVVSKYWHWKDYNFGLTDGSAGDLTFMPTGRAYVSAVNTLTLSISWEAPNVLPVHSDDPMAFDGLVALPATKPPTVIGSVVAYGGPQGFSDESVLLFLDVETGELVHHLIFPEANGAGLIGAGNVLYLLGSGEVNVRNSKGKAFRILTPFGQ